MNLHDFVAESNRIEGIPTVSDDDVSAHEALLGLPMVETADLQSFVRRVAGADLRDRPGMNVRVGGHLPPPGGRPIAAALRVLLVNVAAGRLTPYEAHVEYETLHPFMDGNGRSGRALWAWHMAYVGRDPLQLGFLHAFYYQALQGARA